MSQKEIIYISGAGHSGSTLLDIILGNMDNSISTGELCFFPEKGIKNGEYCACGMQVPNCTFWSEIISAWNEKREMDLDTYIHFQNKLHSKKNVFFALSQFLRPSDKMLMYMRDTKLLYKLIFERSDSTYLIDSSKTPLRVLVLKRIGFKLKIIHLTRQFGHVLNSNKKHSKKDPEKGLEHDMPPLKTRYALSVWLADNLFTFLFSRGAETIRVKYENMVHNPTKTIQGVINNDKSFRDRLSARGPFYPRHLVAGNMIRLKDELYIADKPMDTTYKRLNNVDRKIAKFMDLFY